MIGFSNASAVICHVQSLQVVTAT